MSSLFPLSRIFHKKTLFVSKQCKKPVHMHSIRHAFIWKYILPPAWWPVPNAVPCCLSVNTTKINPYCMRILSASYESPWQKSRRFNSNGVLCQSFSCVLLPAALHGFPPDNHLFLTGGKPTAVLIFTIAWEGSSVNGIFSFLQTVKVSQRKYFTHFFPPSWTTADYQTVHKL